MDDNDGVNKYFNNFHNKYSTFRNVHFVEKNENINKLINQKVEYITPILEHLGNLYDNEQGDNNKKPFINLKLGKKERIFFKKAFKDLFSKRSTDDMFHNQKILSHHKNQKTLTQIENNESHFNNDEGFNSSPIKSKFLNYNKKYLIPLKKKSNPDDESREINSLTSSPVKRYDKRVTLLNRGSSSHKSIISEENIVKSVPSFPLIEAKIGKNKLDSFIQQSSHLHKNIKITSKINNSISSSFLRKTQHLVKEFLIEDDPIEKPVLRKKMLHEYNKLENEKSSINNVNLNEDLKSDYRVEAFDKIANLNNIITYKYGDFIINKYGYEIQKKKYLFNLENKSNSVSPKKLNNLNLKTSSNNHKKIESLLDLTKTKKSFLVDKVEKKISDFNK